MDADQLIDGLFAIWRLMRRAISPHQQSTLTLEQFWLLRQLWRQGPMAIGELAAALGITPGSVTIACKRLEQADMMRMIERVLEVAQSSSVRA